MRTCRLSRSRLHGEKLCASTADVEWHPLLMEVNDDSRSRETRGVALESASSSMTTADRSAKVEGVRIDRQLQTLTI